ncbi:choice-of-anchor D domain-containing protein [Candidatus Poribacteria bacterium]|nr:choice-of-anchor D domain-containing protein [Candidatus Poribacteria bacterium]
MFSRSIKFLILRFLISPFALVFCLAASQLAVAMGSDDALSTPRFPVDGMGWYHAPGSGAPNYSGPGHNPSGGLYRADDSYALDLNLEGNDDAEKPVYAIESGKVIQVNTTWGWVLLEHTGNLSWQGRQYTNYYSGYLHMKNIIVSEGQSISKSHQIGQIGKQQADSEHLHFAIYVGRVVSPSEPLYKPDYQNAFLESVDPGAVAGPEYTGFTYGENIFNHNIDDYYTDSQHIFEKGGTSANWNESFLYGVYDHIYYTLNGVSSDDNWGRWKLEIPISVTASDWKIYVFIPRNFATTNKADYEIYRNSALLTSKTIDQNLPADKWVDIGPFFNFSQGDKIQVYLGDATGETFLSKCIAWDAIKIFRKVDKKLKQGGQMGNLQVTVQNQNGVAWVGAKVVRYWDNGNSHDEKTTDSSGQVTWIDIPTGNYYFEAYYEGANPFDTLGELWTTATKTVQPGDNTLTMRRDWPFAETFQIFRVSDNQELTETSEITAGTEVRLEVTVRNKTGESKSTRVRTLLDRDRTEIWDYDYTTGYLSISANSTHKYTMTFTPTQPGTYYKAVKTEVNPGGKTDAWNWTQTFSVQPVETQPDIAVEPSSWNYGNVTVGSSLDKTFTVSNPGTATLNVTGTSLTGTDANQFSIQSGGGSFSLNPGQTRDIVVRFAPTSAGSKSATLSLANNVPNKNPLNVSLSGTGTAPADLVLNENITVKIGEIKSWEASNSITAPGEGFFFTVEGNGVNGGNVTFTAGSYIILKPGFKSQRGSRFNARINPSLKQLK